MIGDLSVTCYRQVFVLSYFLDAGQVVPEAIPALGIPNFQSLLPSDGT